MQNDLKPNYTHVEHLTSYKDISIALLATIANADRLLFLPEYNAYMNCVHSVVGSMAMEKVQNRILALKLLLTPPKNTEELIAQLQKVIEREQVSLNARKTIVELFLTLLESANQTDYRAIECIKQIVEISLPGHTGAFTIRLEAAHAKTTSFLFPSGEYSLFNAPTQTAKDQQLNTYAGTVNKDIREEAKAALLLGKRIASVPLIEKAEKLLVAIKPQPFRIAIIGESKHGKSSLFNAIVAREISPCNNAFSTSSVVELDYAKDACYSGKWLSATRIKKVKHHSQVKNLTNKLDQWELLQEFNPGETFSFDCISELKEYVSSAGNFSFMAEKVKISLPLPALGEGIALLDTPPLNSPIDLHWKIINKIAAGAHCIVLMLRADKLATQLEQKFLEELVSQGSGFSLMVVVTHLEYAVVSKKTIQEQIQGWIQSTCLENIRAHIHLVDTNKSLSQNTNNGFCDFYKSLAKILGDQKLYPTYTNWMQKRLSSLHKVVKSEKKAFLAKADKIYQASTLEQMKTLQEKLEKITNELSEEMEKRIKHNTAKLEQLATDFDQDSYNTIAKIRAIFLEKIAAQSKKTKRQELEQKVFPGEVKKEFKDICQKYEQKLLLIYEELKSFARDMVQKVSLQMKHLKNISKELGLLYASEYEIYPFRHKMEKAFVQLEKQLDLLAVEEFTPNLSQILHKTPIAIGSTTTSKLSKGNFVKAKENEIGQILNNFYNNISTHYKKELRKMTGNFLALAKGYRPLIEQAQANYQEIELQQKLLKRLQEDALSYISS